MGDNGTLKARKPQLADSITRLDGMVDSLATAIPGAVAESVREVLGPAFAAALKDAVRDAVKEAVAEAVRELALKGPSAEPPPPPPPAPPAPPAKPGVWARARKALGRLKKAAAKTFAPVVARVALGWAVARTVGASTAKSWRAGLATALAAAVTGLAGYALGPVASAVLLGLLAGGAAAVAAWAGPAVALLAAAHDDWPGGAAS